MHLTRVKFYGILFILSFLPIITFFYISQSERFGTYNLNTTLKKAIERDIVIGIITTGKLCERLHDIFTSWGDEYRNLIYVFTDNINPECKLKHSISNYIITNCSGEYTDGLVCKNEEMIKYFNEHLNNRKWLMRAMDDTYIHVENLYDLLITLDENESILIGERYCHYHFDYPTGGPGMVMSNAFLREFNFSLWYESSRFIYDDLVWGEYLKHANSNFIHHNGFSQISAHPKYNKLYQEMIKQRNSWKYPFRPIAYHQHNKKSRDYMKELHTIFHSINYDNIDEYNLLENHSCHCWRHTLKENDREHRCTIHQSLKKEKYCRIALAMEKCLMMPS